MFIFCSEEEFMHFTANRPKEPIVIIDSSLNNERKLIDHYAKAINSPFPHDNWNGWLDTICDLSWHSHEYVSVFHRSLPALSKRDLSFYIGAMIHADSYWSSYVPYFETAEYPEWASYGLKVYFDTSLQKKVLDMYALLKDEWTTVGNLP